MRRSRPTVPCPAGGPPRRGCLYICRFGFLLIALIWAGVWLGWPDPRPLRKLKAAAGLSVAAAVFLFIPLANFADRLEMRRYCRARGFKVLKLQWRGVVYMDGDQKRYSRWPDDFKPGADELI